jgi:hypothetical protein
MEFIAFIAGAASGLILGAIIALIFLFKQFNS